VAFESAVTELQVNQSMNDWAQYRSQSGDLLPSCPAPGGRAGGGPCPWPQRVTGEPALASKVFINEFPVHESPEAFQVLGTGIAESM